mmetsp:Transcript_15254/g.45242  ORF Transcript_15254/g.45242 Transcript_15254/m.45242 type:complete len:247 (-) Transcript_15254:1005-1745(-)
MLGQLDDGRFGEWHPRRQRLQLREDRVERRAAGVERELHQRRRLLAEARGGLAAGGLVRPDGHLEQVEAAARRLDDVERRVDEPRVEEVAVQPQHGRAGDRARLRLRQVMPEGRVATREGPLRLLVALARLAQRANVPVRRCERAGLGDGRGGELGGERSARGGERVEEGEQRLCKVGASLARQLGGQDVDAEHQHAGPVQVGLLRAGGGVVDEEGLVDGGRADERLDGAVDVAGEIRDRKQALVA